MDTLTGHLKTLHRDAKLTSCSWQHIRQPRLWKRRASIFVVFIGALRIFSHRSIQSCLRYVCEIAESVYYLRDFCLSVRPTAWNNSAPTGQILIKLDIGVYFKNLSRKFKFRVLYVRTYVHLWIYLAYFFLEWDFFSDKCCRKNQSTHFVCQ